ncbi:MAG: DUF1573 domain-containing protein [Planctomycetaceae bacterium]|nr:DUF1573 domain-containing protein [Planctomycetaceae bacterium]
MRLLATLIVSCFLGIVTAVVTIEWSNRNAIWYPEYETRLRYTPKLEPAKKKMNPNAKAFVPEGVYDFGVLRREQKGEYDFVVENRGTANLTLKVDRTSCTCTGVDVSNKNVKPGDKSIVTVHWKAESSQPTFTQSALLLTNDPENPELIFHVKGLYMSPVMASPASLQFPSILSGREENASFRLYGLEKRPLEITEIRSSSPEYFETSVEPGELTEEDRKSTIFQSANNVLVVNVKVKPGFPTGAFQERLIISTNYESEPTLEYFVRGMIQAGNVQIVGKDYVKDTGVINIGKTTLGRPISSKITVTFQGRSSDDVDLTVAKSDPSFVQVNIEKLPGEKAIFVITITVSATTAGNWYGPEQKIMGLLELETNVPESPTLKLPLQFLVEKE